MTSSNHARSPPSSAHSGHDEIDSAATTLLASASGSRNHSFDEQQEIHGKSKYAGFELDRYEARERFGRRNSKDGSKSEDEEDDGSSQEGDRQGEEEHLLAHDTAALNLQSEHPAAATNTHADEGEPPAPSSRPDEKAKPVSWSSLPKKSQLAILTLARLSEPLTQTSLQAYMFYQLKSFKTASGETPSDSTVAQQAGVLAAAFTFAQFLTAIMWGRLADSERLGRKKVILIGLFGTAIGSLGFGFSGSFATAVFWRGMGGMLNGNMGVMRTMISEIVKEKKFQSRAFLLLPMTFNIGVIIGPLLGGLLADPVGSYPHIFGPGGSIGGEKGVWWLTRWPYALPNVVSACFLTGSALGVTFGLEETLEALRDKPDYGLRFSRWVARTLLFRRESAHQYAALVNREHAEADVEMSAITSKKTGQSTKTKQKLPFRRIWTSNILFTLLAHGILAMHVGTFNNLWFVFLSTPRYDSDPAHQSGENAEKSLQLPKGYHAHAPFTFTGGLALPPPSIGTALAILGVIGISLQLLLYPRISFRLGTTTSFRFSLLLFPVSYFLVPFLATIPSSLPAPAQASGILVWLSITLVLLVQVTARTFALPSTAILVNNACPHPSVLGTIHGIAQSVASAARTFGPVFFGMLYGVGLEKGVVGLAWWCMAGVAVLGAVAGTWVREGDGHEIWLEGEKEELQRDNKGR